MNNQKWHVVTTFYDDGAKGCVIIDGRECPDDQLPKTGQYNDYTLDVDTFDNLIDAEKFKRALYA